MKRKESYKATILRMLRENKTVKNSELMQATSWDFRKYVSELRTQHGLVIECLPHDKGEPNTVYHYHLLVDASDVKIVENAEGQMVVTGRFPRGWEVDEVIIDEPLETEALPKRTDELIGSTPMTFSEEALEPVSEKNHRSFELSFYEMQNTAMKFKIQSLLLSIYMLQVALGASILVSVGILTYEILIAK